MLLVLASAAPVAVIVVLLLACRTGAGAESVEPLSRSAPGESNLALTEGGWDGFSAEVARLERRRRLPGSDATLRKRHLAAVLPADARR